MDEKKNRSPSVSDISEYTDGVDESCGMQIGCGSCRTRRIPIPCLSCGNNAKMFLGLLSIIVLIQGMIVNGLINIVITTIEKRFHLQSSETGFLAGCYDLGFLIAVPFVTYVGGRGHKPQWIGWGVFIMGLGSITFSLPHFIAPTYSVKDVQSYMCAENSTLNDCGEAYLRTYLGFFILGHILHGIGACGLFTLVVTHIDANVKENETSVYHGVFFAFSVAGPGVGYMVGGALIKLYTNLGEIVTIDESSPHWIGNWWLGYLICGCTCIVLSIPVLLYPEQMPNTERFRRDREKDINRSKESLKAKGDPNFGKRFKDMPRCLMVILKNVTLMCLSVAGAMDSGSIIAMATFGPKYVEAMFRVPPSSAGLYFGIGSILAAFASHLLGGIVVSKLKMGIPAMLKFTIVGAVLALCCQFSFFIKCETPEVPGVNVPYNGETSYLCEGSCGCSTKLYDPVCGADRLTYLSGCDAGCTTTDGNSYVNCTKVLDSGDISFLTEAIATAGKCEITGSCPSVGILIAVASLSVFFTFLKFQPALQISLRTVPFYQRSFAIGIQWVIMRCFGLIPLPLILGRLLDNACLVWHDVCGSCGSCKMYDNDAMSSSMVILLVVAKCISITSLIVAYYTYKPPPADEPKSETKVSVNEDTESTENFGSANGNAETGLSNSLTGLSSYANEAFVNV